ncbi:MAG: hypothetical protein M5R42_19940 [Rhodocyclaceae bacterium]|nr:hypothetical protein [Rhodocyclaceae bacterium]
MRYQFNQDNTPGWSLMTPEERTAHHNAMMSAKTYEECKAAQEAQHKQMEARAKEQGQDAAGAAPERLRAHEGARLLQVAFSSMRHCGSLRRAVFLSRPVEADFRMRRLLRLVFLLFAALAPAIAAEPPALTIHYFHADGCPHCEDAGAFFARLAAEEPRLAVRDYEVSRHPENRALFQAALDALGVEEGGVPFIFVGDWVTLGYHTDATTGAGSAARSNVAWRPVAPMRWRRSAMAAPPPCSRARPAPMCCACRWSVRSMLHPSRCRC